MRAVSTAQDMTLCAGASLAHRCLLAARGQCAQRPAPSAQRPAPSAQRPAPSAQRPAPSTQLKAVHMVSCAARRAAVDGVTVRRVMTDNGPCCTSRAFAAACRRFGVRHVRTKPYTPRTNAPPSFIQTASEGAGPRRRQASRPAPPAGAAGLCGFTGSGRRRPPVRPLAVRARPGKAALGVAPCVAAAKKAGAEHAGVATPERWRSGWTARSGPGGCGWLSTGRPRRNPLWRPRRRRRRQVPTARRRPRRTRPPPAWCRCCPAPRAKPNSSLAPVLGALTKVTTLQVDTERR